MISLDLDDTRGFDIRVLREECHGVDSSIHLRQLESFVGEEPTIEVLRWFDLGDLIGGDNAIPCNLFLTELRDEHR